LRRGLIWLAILGTASTAVELAMLRHWDNALELIPFAALGVLAVAIVLVARSPTGRSIALARALAGSVAFVSAVGVLVHVRANYEAAPLDFRYTDSWPTIPEPIRWFLAATDTVGPSPTLAPAAIAFMALALLIATLGHPARRHTGLVGQPSVVSVRKRSRTGRSIVAPVSSSVEMSGRSADEDPTKRLMAPGSTIRR